jgi:hypothetical protein
MFDFRQELDRRIEQFRHYLELMPKRQSGLTKGNSFIIFEERCDDDDSGSKTLTASEALVYQASIEVSGSNATAGFDETLTVDLPDEGWRSDDSSRRFIQFSFNPRYFDLDIPNTTLFRAEAEIILRSRPGFFYVTDRPQFEHPAENAVRFNPLRKVYVHGDESSAAEDMAFVWFNVWKFPVDWRFYVTAAAFHDTTTWEKGFPIE